MKARHSPICQEYFYNRQVLQAMNLVASLKRSSEPPRCRKVDYEFMTSLSEDPEVELIGVGSRPR
jgi:hypothetical protein